jgi:hypothetical protein
MACCLAPSTTAKEDFTATNGSSVTIKLKGPSGVGAEIIHLRYAGAEVTSDPPQFNVKAGAKMLIVLAEASQAGAMLQLIESCAGGTEQVLDRFHYDPMNPARGYIVRGMAS